MRSTRAVTVLCLSSCAWPMTGADRGSVSASWAGVLSTSHGQDHGRWNGHSWAHPLGRASDVYSLVLTAALESRIAASILQIRKPRLTGLRDIT